MTASDICRLIEGKFREGLVPCQPWHVDVEELPGEKWQGLWRVTAWGQPAEGIAADVDVEAKNEDEAIDLAYVAFVTRTREEWIAEMPVVL